MPVEEPSTASNSDVHCVSTRRDLSAHKDANPDGIVLGDNALQFLFNHRQCPSKLKRHCRLLPTTGRDFASLQATELPRPPQAGLL
ncbi:MAG TPA: hypothetical protein VMX97_05710, partial [Hyphomicrobiaceae bacterium]|nr:hypothetical protein [Hyphomicrobiaceae bacterium]